VLTENVVVGCKICVYALQAHIGNTLTFADEAQTQKLRAFDIFAGASIMSLGIENVTDSMRITHAVEISLSVV
jgi:hypothetical protein